MSKVCWVGEPTAISKDHVTDARLTIFCNLLVIYYSLTFWQGYWCKCWLVMSRALLINCGIPGKDYPRNPAVLLCHAQYTNMIW